MCPTIVIFYLKFCENNDSCFKTMFSRKINVLALLVTVKQLSVGKEYEYSVQ